MPHIVLTHSPSLTDFVAAILPELCLSLYECAPNIKGIKAYGVSISSSCIDDKSGDNMLHLNLRLMKRPERTGEIIELWLTNLAIVIAEKQPDDCTFTAEANFLPKAYMSKTA